MKVRIYIEGGGDSRSLHIRCREGFRKLLERAGFVGRMPSTKACGSRNAAYDDFKTALSVASPEEYPILLVDSETAVTQPSWQHLRQHDGWDRPEEAAEDQAQLMIQCMETWCVADRDALTEFFGQNLQDTALPALIGLESKSKADVQEALVNATRTCGREKQYAKGRRSFELVAHLDPDTLKRHLPHFRSFCDILRSKL